MFAYLQLERITDGEIDVNDAVVFDNVLSSDGTAISYNMTTGELAFNEAGFYAINWFVAPQFGLTTDGSNFAILSDGGYALTGSSHVKVSPTVGFAVIEVTTPGKRISLINISDNSLTLSQVVNTKAALVAFGPEGAAPDLPYLNNSVLENLNFNVVNQTAQANLDFYNPATGARTNAVRTIPIASANVTGLVPKETMAAVTSLATRVSALEQSTIRYSVAIPEEPTQPELQALYEAASGNIGEAPDGTRLVDPSTGVAYEWFASSDTWYASTPPAVSLATQLRPGIVQGSPDPAEEPGNPNAVYGKIYVEDDGTMSLLGWDMTQAELANLDNRILTISLTPGPAGPPGPPGPEGPPMPTHRQEWIDNDVNLTVAAAIAFSASNPGVLTWISKEV